MQLQEINGQLRQVPRLIDKLEHRDPDLLEAVLRWLKQTEQILENHQLPLASRIAANRALLVQAQRGQAADTFGIVGKTTRRKLRDAAASVAIRNSCELLNTTVQSRQSVFDEAEKIASQVVAVARIKGLFSRCSGLGSHSQVLFCIKQEIAKDPDLISAYTHLEGLVGVQDALVLLDTAAPDLK